MGIEKLSRQQRRKLERDEQKRQKATYNLTKAQLDEVVQKEATAFVESKKKEMKQEIYYDAVNDAMVLLLALPMIVLRRDYWKKSFHSKCKDFCNSVIELYEKWQEGEVNIEELKNMLWELGGVKFVVNNHKDE